MGCDIHVHVEIKLKGSDRWSHWNAPNIDRNYMLFGMMAGVRNEDVPPISPPKGCPPDLSPETRWALDHWGSDAHTVSWFNKDEIATLEAWWEQREILVKKANPERNLGFFDVEIMGGYLNGGGYTGELRDGVEDVRLVFWFDN